MFEYLKSQLNAFTYLKPVSQSKNILSIIDHISKLFCCV